MCVHARRRVCVRGGGLAEQASEAPQRAKPQFGEPGAGGARNAPNFQDAVRTSNLAASDVTLEKMLDPEEIAAIKELNESHSSNNRATDTEFQKVVIHPLAAAAVEKFGAQPATAVVGIYERLATLVLKHVKRDRVQKGETMNIATKLSSRAGEL